MNLKTVLFQRECGNGLEKGILVIKNNNYIVLTENLEVVTDIWNYQETGTLDVNFNFKNLFQGKEEQ